MILQYTHNIQCNCISCQENPTCCDINMIPISCESDKPMPSPAVSGAVCSLQLLDATFAVKLLCYAVATIQQIITNLQESSETSQNSGSP